MTTKLQTLSKEISKIDFCMFNTKDRSGTVNSRPMSNNGDVEYDGDSWFFSYENTKKVDEIGHDRAITLTFTAPPSILGKPGIFIAVYGEASLIRDKALFEKHWVKGLDRWFTQGIDTPGIVLVKVSASEIEYWDGEENERLAVRGTDAVTAGAT